MQIINKNANLEMAVRNREQVSHILINLIQRLNTIEQTIVTTPFISDAIIDGVTNIAPSQNAVYDALLFKANDDEVIHDTGINTLNGRLIIQSALNTALTVVSPDSDAIVAISESLNGVPITAQNTNGGDLARFNNVIGGDVAKIDNSGNYLGQGFIKEGGLGTEFLMADGTTTDLGNISLVETDTLQSVTGRGDITTNDVTFDSTVYLPNLAGLPNAPNNIGVDLNGAIVSIPTEVSATGAVQISATNKTGSTIIKGSVVYINGAQGSKATIDLALADTNIATSQSVGLVIADITANGSGYVTILGEVTNLNTASFANGDKVFLSSTIAGGLTNIVPTSPNNVVFIGTVSNSHATQGKIIVNILYTFKLDRLSDVVITGTPNRALLMYDNGTGLWKNSFLNSLDVTTALGYTPENVANKGLANGYASLDVSGLVPITQIPPSALERLVVVANQAARFALNTSQAQNGDTVKEIDTGLMYFIKDDTNLANANGYEVYRAGSAASVPWSGVTGTPITLAGYGITDAVPTTRALNINGTSLDLSVNREWRTAQADTGVLTFAGLTTNSATTINIGAVSGFIVDNETNPDVPTYVKITYPGEGAKTVTSVGTGTGSYVMLGVGNVITFQNTFPTSAERKAKIWLGKVSHPAGAVTLVVNEPDYITSPMSFSRDMLQALGGFVNTGVYPYTNGANLNINTTGADILGDGINFVNSRVNPNQITIPAGIAQSFVYRTRTGGATGAVTSISPGFYDLAGAVTAVPGGPNVSTIQYIFCVPGQGFVIQYGQTVYSTFVEAVSAVGKEPFVKFSNLTNNAILIGVLAIKKSTTALNNAADAAFFLADRLGGLIGSAAGTSTTTLQLAYNNSVEPEIITNTANGAFSLQRGSLADTDLVFEIKNGAVVTTASITGTGIITGSQIRKTGGLATEFLMADGSVTSALNTATVVAGTTYTLLSTDYNKQVIFSSATPVTVTIPLGLPVGFICEAYQQGAGKLSFITPVGGTLRYQTYELPQSEEQYSIIGIEGIVNMTDTYKLYGQLQSI